MLSLRRCRDILGPSCPLTDLQVEALRDEMVCLAEISLEQVCRNIAQENGGILGSTKPLPDSHVIASGDPKLPRSLIRASAFGLLPRFGQLSQSSSVGGRVPPNECYELHERAAILEFDAGMRRSDAEHEALRQ
jgi:hypothetical protein